MSNRTVIRLAPANSAAQHVDRRLPRVDTAVTYGKLAVVDDPDGLAHAAADRLCAWALETSGPVRIALSGGSTPRRTYHELASPRLVGRFPWQRVHWFWGDERFVSPDDPESNYRMAREAMLARAPVPRKNIHPIPTVDISPIDAAARYEAELRRVYGGARLTRLQPLFDVCLLGLGDDGHIASLLPGEPVLNEHTHWVAAVAHGRPEARITLTYPAINASKHIAFLVSGATKRCILHEVLSGRSTVPAARLQPGGELLFIADRDAVGA
jgi:6-phosphogluconolactonase